MVASYMWVKNSGPIAMHKPYKSNNISCKNTFGVKKVWPSKVESYMEVNAWTDWWQQDNILEYGQGLAYWTLITLDTLKLAYVCFQSLIGLAKPYPSLNVSNVVLMC